MAQQQNPVTDPRAALLAGGVSAAGKLGAQEVKDTKGLLGKIIHHATSVLHRDPQDPRGPLVVMILKSSTLNEKALTEILVQLGTMTTGTVLEDTIAKLFASTGTQQPPCYVHKSDGTTDQIDLNTPFGLAEAGNYQNDGYIFRKEADGAYHGRKVITVQAAVVPAAAIANPIDNPDDVVDVMRRKGRREVFVRQVVVKVGITDSKLHAVKSGDRVEKFMEV